MILSVQITVPAADIEIGDEDYMYDDYSSTYDLWYKDVELQGFAFDVDDGQLSGSSMRWSTNRTDLAPHASGTLGYGESITVRLYSDNVGRHMASDRANGDRRRWEPKVVCPLDLHLDVYLGRTEAAPVAFCTQRDPRAMQVHDAGARGHCCFVA